MVSSIRRPRTNMDGQVHQPGSWGQARILLVEDDAAVREAVETALAALGWETEGVPSGEEALAAFGRSSVDLVILDLGLPGLPGIEVLRQLRARSEVPVLVMTASGGLDDRVTGFDLGADDYVVKPFELAELERRVRAILRRTTGPRPDDVLHGPADIRLLLRAHEAYVGERQVHLTPKEFEVLRVLLARRGEVIPPDDLSVQIWGYETFGSRNYVEAHVSRLRGKLAECGADGVIGTVRGVGYMVR
ncbi:MAG: response regulator transcription factor [Dehalococcoidia bacterium]|nr:response regulator transcription factor [Dehalococcoidia bacterium]